VDELDDITYDAMVAHMQREAAAITAANSRLKR
jgi:hypothetical protein